jgi:hypothetical protein
VKTERLRFEEIIRDILQPDQAEQALRKEGKYYAEYATTLAWAVFRAAEAEHERARD